MGYMEAIGKDIKIEKFDENLHDQIVPELTEMLHAAYRPLADIGLKYVATHQPPETTLSRLRKGDSFLGFKNDELVSTITIVQQEPHEPCDWYQRPEVFFFTQFAVKPKYQGSGLGSYLMDFAEEFAIKNGASELALDTSEHADHLISFYKKRGYRLVDFADWSETNYKSLVLSKALNTEKIYFRLADNFEGELLTDLALRSKGYWKYDQDYLSGCRNALTVDKTYINDWVVVIGEKDSSVVGFFALKIVDGENRLDHLWVEPEHIGNGYGRDFFQEAKYRAKKLDWDSFRLAADPPAQGFYEKMGMQKIGTVQSRIKPDLFLPHMEIQVR